MEKKQLLPRFSAPCNLHPADWLLMAPVDTLALIIVFKSIHKDSDGAFSAQLQKASPGATFDPVHLGR